MRLVTMVVSLCLCVCVNRDTCGQQEVQLLPVLVPVESSGEYDIVRAKDVMYMDAEMYNTPDFPQRLPAVERFRVPTAEHQSILEYFSEPHIDRLPRLRWPEIGSIKLTLRDGTVKRVCYYWRGGKGPLWYSLNGVRCVSGRKRDDAVDEALTLDAVLRRIHGEVQREREGDERGGRTR